MSAENILSLEKLKAKEVGVLKSLNMEYDDTSGDEGAAQSVQAVVREVFDARYQGPEGQTAVYDKVADNYEQYIHAVGCLASDIAAEYVNKYSHLLPKIPRILDAFTGTGLVGEKLHKLYRFSNIDGFDGCSKMLKVAEAKNVYKLLTNFSVEVDKPLPFGRNVYDAVVMSAALYRVSDFLEFIRISKPGGIIVHVVCHGQLSSELGQLLLPSCHQWEKEGRWRCLLEEVSNKPYDKTSPAFVQVYQVL